MLPMCCTSKRRAEPVLDVPLLDQGTTLLPHRQGRRAAGATDIDYAYPRGAFRSDGSVAKVALELETVMLGAYLGAVEGIQTAALTPVVARIAASEAQHVAYLSTIKGLSSFQAFPNPMTIQQVSNALDVYTA